MMELNTQFGCDPMNLTPLLYFGLLLFYPIFLFVFLLNFDLIKELRNLPVDKTVDNFPMRGKTAFQSAEKPRSKARKNRVSQFSKRGKTAFYSSKSAEKPRSLST